MKDHHCIERSVCEFGLILVSVFRIGQTNLTWIFPPLDRKSNCCNWRRGDKGKQRFNSLSVNEGGCGPWGAKLRDRKRTNFPDSRLWCAKSFLIPNPKSSQSVRKLSKVFINTQSFWTLSTVFKNFAVSTNFPECMGSFQRARKHSIVPGNFLDCLETFQSVQIVFKGL